MIGANVRRRVLDDWTTFVPSKEVLASSVRDRTSEIARRHRVGA